MLRGGLEMDVTDTTADTHQYITDAGGKRTHIVLSVEEYEELVDRILDFQDIEIIRERRREGGYISLEEMKQRLGR
jgi:hypothetical protein